MVTSFYHCNDITERHAARVWPTCGCSFYLSLGLVQVCEIELSHMGKNKGNPDQVCEKMFTFPKQNIWTRTQDVGT